MDGWLEIRDGAGKVLTSKDDSGSHTSPDPVLEWTAPNSDPHFVVIRDLRRQGGEQFRYQLTLRRAQPEIELTVAQDNWTIAPSGSAEVKVAIARLHGHDKPITLQAKDLPPGLSCEPVVVEPDKKEAVLTIKATAEAVAQSTPFRISNTDSQSATHPYKGTSSDAGALMLNVIEQLWITVPKNKS